MKDQKNTQIIKPNQDIPSIVNVLEKKLAEIKTITDCPYKTTGVFDAGGIKCDIKSETSISNLLNLVGVIKVRENAYNEAQRTLGLKSVPAFTVSGYSSSAWVDDVKLRIAVIEHDETVKKITKFKEEFSKLMTQEDQKKLLMSQFEAEFGN